MKEKANLVGSYRIEVSGWSFDSNFFVEQTDLVWDRSGDKKVSLRHALAPGAIVFIRLLVAEPGANTLPVTYEVAAADPMDCNGQCEIRLKQLHPRTKAPRANLLASYVSEDTNNACEPKDSSAQSEYEEILQ